MEGQDCAPAVFWQGGRVFFERHEDVRWWTRKYEAACTGTRRLMKKVRLHGAVVTARTGMGARPGWYGSYRGHDYSSSSRNHRSWCYTRSTTCVDWRVSKNAKDEGRCCIADITHAAAVAQTGEGHHSRPRTGCAPAERQRGTGRVGRFRRVRGSPRSDTSQTEEVNERAQRKAIHSPTRLDGTRRSRPSAPGNAVRHRRLLAWF